MFLIASAKKIGITTLKVLAWLLGTVAGLLVLVIVALQFPRVQQFAAQKGADYLQNTLNTTVRIGSFTTDWRNAVVLKNVYIEDQQQDTLWYSGRLGLDIKIFDLLSGQVNIDRVHLQNATANIHIRPDSSTNFGFILEAFATDTTLAQPADTAAALKINLGVINLENLYVNFQDEYGGNHIQGRVGQLLTTMDELDLDAEKYLIDEVELRNTWVKYTQTKLPPETPSEPLTMKFGLNRVLVENTRVNYKSTPADQFINLAVGQAELTTKNIDLANAKVELNKFALHNTTVAYAQEKYKPQDSLAVKPAETLKEIDKSVEKTQGEPVNWVITLANLDVTGLKAEVDNFNVPAQPRGMDFDHLAFDSVNVRAEDIFYSFNRMGGTFQQVQLKEKSGFRLNDFEAKITIDSTQSVIENLSLATANTDLKSEATLRYPSLAAIAEKPETLWLDAVVDNSLIGMRDVLYFVPDLAQNPSFRPVSNSLIKVDAKVEGTLANLAIEHFRASGLRGTDVLVSGNVRNATDPDKLYLNLNINKLASTRTDVLALVPKGTIPPEIQIPPTFSMSGRYIGSLTNFDANANIRTSYGNLTADVDMDAGRKGAEPFKAKISTQGFDVGKLLTDDMGLGKVSADATITGTGLDPNQMVAQLKANVRSLEYNGYTYQNVVVNSGINRNLYTVDASSNDPNLAFTLGGTVNMRDAKKPDFNLNLKLDGVNLQALNLYPEDIRIEGNLTTDLSGMDLRSLNGSITGNKIIVVKDGKRYPVDSLNLSITQKAPLTEIKLTSDVANANIRTENNLEDFISAASKHFSNYFDLQPDPPFTANLALRDFSFDIRLRKTELITAFVPGLERLVASGPITGSYDGETQDLKVKGALQRITYLGYDVKAASINLTGDRTKIDYAVTVKELSDSSLLVNNISLTGTARDNTISTTFGIAEADSSQQRLVLGGLLTSAGIAKGFRFAIDPEKLVLNGDKWSVPAENFVQFSSKVLYANNVKLERNGSFIALNSSGPIVANAPLNVEFGNFQISTIMEMIQRQDSTFSGTINGTAQVTNLMAGTMGFTSDLTVSQFAYMGNPVGDIALKASSASATLYNIEAALTGNGNQVSVRGSYDAQPTTGVLNLTADINTLNLKSFESFAQGAVKDVAGTANGNLRITGTVADPDIAGDLNFNAAQFNVAMLNAVYKLPNERVTFTPEGIRLQNITVADASNNQMKVNGMVFTTNYTDYRFDLTASANRFLAMNSTGKDNDLYYGTLWVKANATIKGDQNSPVIDATVSVLDGSDLTIVVPGEAAGASERAGVVEFVDLSDSMALVMNTSQELPASNTGITGFEVNVNLALTDATPITVVIDPVTGDNMTVRGKTQNLAAAMNTRGDIKLSGRYTVTEGSYKMIVYNLISRELELKEGGYIQWNGDPMQADMNITAIYNVRTAPMELLAEPGADPATISQYRTPMAFQVHVNLEGELTQPEIAFDVQVPENERSSNRAMVEARLQNLRTDEAELNKQAFSLMVLGRFMAEDPLASSGGGVSAAARSSVGQVMTDQLNKLSDQYAGGLGLEFGVNSYEDYSSGTGEGRTDVNVALRQQLFNDRVTVRVGADVGVEGRSREANSMSNFGGDISVEYTILPDGRLRVRGFRRNNFELIEGDVQETGLALIYVRDYNNFSDLFRGKERRLERQQERKTEEREKVKEEAVKDRKEEEADPTPKP